MDALKELSAGKDCSNTEMLFALLAQNEDVRKGTRLFWGGGGGGGKPLLNGSADRGWFWGILEQVQLARAQSMAQGRKRSQGKCAPLDLYD